MKRLNVLVICGLLVGFGGLSWIGEAEDQESPDIQRPIPNDGAGLANNAQLASWLKVAMPLDEADLTQQEALDLAAFINSHERPKFRLSEHLPPREQFGTFNSKLRTENVDYAK